jgi:putative ABC transport system permease protein
MNGPDLWMRALLRAYPPGFRAQFGREMRATFADAFRARRAAGARASLLANSVLDTVQSAAAEWRDVFTTIRPPRLMASDWIYAIRHAARALRRNPGFTAATVLTLAVGIGATTAVFSVMSTALLTPLPYPNANRLVAIAESKRGDEISISYPDLLDFQSRSRVFDAVAGFVGQNVTLTGTGTGDPERIRGQVITANLFSTLGVHPILGHDFAPADDAANAARVVAISHSLWVRHFGADSTIIGRTVTFNSESFTVTAVMPPGFRFPDGIVYGPAEAWMPMSQIDAGDRDARDNHPGIEAVGLMRRGTSLTQARADLVRVSADLSKEHVESNRGVGVIVNDAIDAIVGTLSSVLVLLFGASATVLLIACANVAGLLLTRADARRREMAIKIALGADGMRVTANFAGEAVLLSIAGGAVGVGLAFGLVKWFGFAVADLPRLETLSVDVRALGVAAAATILIAVVCSIAPVFWARSASAGRVLRVRGAAGTLASRMRNAFVVAQVALSLVLLTTATLLLRTFERMSASDGGIRADGVLTFMLQLSDARYGVAAGARGNFVRELTGRLAAQPGVTGAAVISLLPFSGGGSDRGAHGAGRDGADRTLARSWPVAPAHGAWCRARRCRCLRRGTARARAALRHRADRYPDVRRRGRCNAGCGGACQRNSGVESSAGVAADRARGGVAAARCPRCMSLEPSLCDLSRV